MVHRSQRSLTPLGSFPEALNFSEMPPGRRGSPSQRSHPYPSHFRRGPTTPDPPTRPHPLSTDHAPATPLRWPLLCWPQPLLPSPRFCPCNGGYPRRLCPAHSTASPLRPRPAPGSGPASSGPAPRPRPGLGAPRPAPAAASAPEGREERGAGPSRHKERLQDAGGRRAPARPLGLYARRRNRRRPHAQVSRPRGVIVHQGAHKGGLVGTKCQGPAPRSASGPGGPASPETLERGAGPVEPGPPAGRV